ncbi:hypothetical protein D3C84_564760 [compost metagenome]
MRASSTCLAWHSVGRAMLAIWFGSMTTAPSSASRLSARWMVEALTWKIRPRVSLFMRVVGARRFSRIAV